jgi:hypothetical protein
MKKKRSKILDAVQESAKDLYSAGAIDQVTAEKFNIVRLDPEIADAFPTSKAVNEALSVVLRAAKNARLSKRR